MDHPAGARAGARRRHPAAPGRHRPRRRPAARGRRDRGRPVRADRRVAARRPAQPATRCSPGRSSGKARSAPWSMPPAPTPTSARPPNWSRTAHTVSHFQRAVLKIGNYLIILAVALVAVIVVVAILRGDAILTTLQFALVLTVAAIPVAMPTVLSVTMAVGARLLAKKQAIVSRLVAIEELAGVDVLCADKTGTLTQNSLTLGTPFSRRRRHPRRGHPRRRVGLPRRQRRPHRPRGARRPRRHKRSCRLTPSPTFNPSTRCTNAPRPPSPPPTGPPSGSPKAPRRSSWRWPPTPRRSSLPPIKAVNDFAARGFRSLGVARGDDGDGDWQFVGVLPLFDPPRDDAAATISTAARWASPSRW